MLDHLSYFPSPKGKEAADEIFNKIMTFPTESLIKTEHDKNIIKKYILSFVNSNPPKCSYAGWITGELDDYVNTCISNYEKKILIRRKFKGIIKSIVYINLIYKEFIEKYYAPNGLFEKNMSNYWNPMLKKNSVWPPPPPENK